MPRHLRWLPLLMLAALAGCATLTPYQRLANGFGYSEQKIESNRWRVSYGASSRTPAATVDNYLLYRAAELALDQGDDGFVLVDRSFSGAPGGDGGTRVSVGGFGGTYGSGIGIGFGTGVGDGPPWLAAIDIVTYRGARPANEPKAYDARQVRDSLAPSLARPRP